MVQNWVGLRVHEDKLVTQEPTEQYVAFSNGFSINIGARQIQKLKNSAGAQYAAVKVSRFQNKAKHTS